ncbi:MAG: hypothetical protein ACE360_10325 [Hyphomicrobiales bacterium]
MEIGTDNDPSPITGAIEIDSTMIVIKEGGVYEVQLADQIDPDRINIDVPNAQQQILAHGSGTEFVRQTLVTAEALFRSNCVADHVDKNEVLSASLAAAKDLAAMADLLDQIATEVGQGTAAKVEGKTANLPALKELEPRVKTFIQKADHVLQSLMRIIRAFFGQDAGRKWFESLHELTAHRFGTDDGFALFLGEALPYLKSVRAARNCVEHPREGQKLVLKNFSLQTVPLAIVPPTIKVVHPNHAMPEAPLVTFLQGLQGFVSCVFEETLAGLCNKNLREFGAIKFGVVETPAEKRTEFDSKYRVTIIEGPPLPNTAATGSVGDAASEGSDPSKPASND